MNPSQLEITFSPRFEQQSYSPMVFNVWGRKWGFRNSHAKQSLSFKSLTLKQSLHGFLDKVECGNDEQQKLSKVNWKFERVLCYMC